MPQLIEYLDKIAREITDRTILSCKSVRLETIQKMDFSPQP